MNGDYVATIVIHQQLYKDVILRINFLQEHDAVITIRDQLVIFKEVELPRKSSATLNLRTIGDTTVPPRPCVLVGVKREDLTSDDEIVKSVGPVVLQQIVAIARGFVTIRRSLQNVCSKISQTCVAKSPKGLKWQCFRTSLNRRIYFCFKASRLPR